MPAIDIATIAMNIMASSTSAPVLLAAAAAALFVILSCLQQSTAAPIIGMPGCNTSCGDVRVPYPFGLGPSRCYQSAGFNLTCDTTRQGSPRLLLGGGGNSSLLLQVVDISLKNNTVRVVGAGNLVNGTRVNSDRNVTFAGGLLARGGPYTMSLRNELVLFGCNVMATVVTGGKLSCGCASFCSFGYAFGGPDRYCSGTGCCQASMSTIIDLTQVEVHLSWLPSGSNISYNDALPVAVFVGEEGWLDRQQEWGYNQPGEKGHGLAQHIPFLLRWDITQAPVFVYPDRPNPYACPPEIASLCKSQHSECTPDDEDSHYICRCITGYDGNPYVPGGCQDIDECEHPKEHACYGECINTIGWYSCRCPRGTQGNHSRPNGCVPVQAHKFSTGSIVGITVGSTVATMLLVLVVILMIQRFKHTRAIKLKQKYFKQNRGQLLQQLVSQRTDIAERMIIPVDELAKATNDFDKARELGGGGHGTVDKGILSDLHVVAIKKPKITVQKEIDEFINEVAILSQINHRNIVRLFGCCLETEVPLLVYEFISNGTLYHHLHDEQGLRSLSWGNRLRIATETAKANAYLHSSISVPIIHRDIKSSNILLDVTMTSKVSDFGASRYIPIDRTGLTTRVQGTVGYLDPMYFYTGHLNEKSDVYSFGVILVELLTRKKPFSYLSSNGDGLVMHFTNLLAEDNLTQILDPLIIEEGGQEVQEVATLAASCINLASDERPTMRQVELILEGIQESKKSVHVNMVAEEFKNDGIAVNLPYTEEMQSTEESNRTYSIEQELLICARHPR